MTEDPALADLAHANLSLTNPAAGVKVGKGVARGTRTARAGVRTAKL